MKLREKDEENGAFAPHRECNLGRDVNPESTDETGIQCQANGQKDDRMTSRTMDDVTRVELREKNEEERRPA